MQAVLWDLDGTIADSEELHFAAWRMILEPFGVDYPLERFRRDFGRANPATIRGIFGDAIDDEAVERISSQKEATYRHLLRTGSLQPLPGVLDWLEAFERQGLPQAVSSSGPMANIVSMVEALQIADFFRSLVSGIRLPRSKPDPMIFQHTAAALDVPPARCMVIEDSVHGVEAARRAGMPCAVVGRLSGDRELPALLARMEGPACLPLPSLAELTWEGIERLWAS